MKGIEDLTIEVMCSISEHDNNRNLFDFGYMDSQIEKVAQKKGYSKKTSNRLKQFIRKNVFKLGTLEC